MQDLYMCHLPLTPIEGDTDAAFDRVDGTIEAWLRDRIGIDGPVGTRPSERPDGQASARLLTLADQDRRLRRYDVRQVDHDRPTWDWRVTLWLGRDHASTWLRCRLGAVALDGRIVDPDLPVGRPRVVGEVLHNEHVLVDGRRLGVTSTISSTDLPGLVDFLVDPARRLPVVIVTPGPSGRGLIDPNALADRLGGLAHVISLAARTTTFALTEAIGFEHSVFNGGIRLYWPDFDPSRASRQPLWLPSRVETLGLNGTAEQLFRRIGRVSTLALAAPELERALRIEQARRAQTVAAEQAAKASQRLSASVLENEEWEREFERTLQAEARLSGQLEEAELRILELEDELHDMRRAYTQFTQYGQADEADAVEAPVQPPTTVLEAVQQAQAKCPHLVFLPEAFESAHASGFPRPTQVLGDLLAIEDVAARWQRGELTGDFRTAFDGQPVTFRTGISDTALRQYPGDYTRTYEGRQIVLGPHTRRGRGSPANILRIYWSPDPDNWVFVIGHIGRKLRDDSNP